MTTNVADRSAESLETRFTRRHILAGAGTGLAASLIATNLSAFPFMRSVSASQAAGDISGRVDIGDGRQMFIQSRGAGDPTVVFLSGYLNTGGAWTVLPEEVSPPSVYSGVAEFTRVCTYDRPGTRLDADPPDDYSQSDPVPQPATVESAVSDLNKLLTSAGIPGPYVLVGHSFGGLISRLYASSFPDDVVGMVLVDPFSEAIRAAMPGEHWKTWLSTNGVLSAEELAENPDIEQFDIDAAADSLERVIAAQPLSEMPLVALTAGLTGHMTPDQIAALPPGYYDALTEALEANATFLANLLPDVRHRYVTDSGHYIQAEKPEIVIDAVWQVVEAVRSPGTWSASREGALR